mmetsp:Transcript_46954/g.132430  ORF Transcript_46954/g.132430 Transcript_46954/m.132430 type:complete len:322 (-) Transcript_46954:216-1181(-)
MRRPSFAVLFRLAWLGVRCAPGIRLPQGNLSESVDLLWSGTGVHVVTVDTRSHPVHPMAGPVGLAGAQTYIRNLGSGARWEDLRTKVAVMREWLETRPVPPNDIVVFVDGDVVYGGCSLSDFKERLLTELSATNTSIVFGVEAQCNDYNGDCDEDYPHRYYDEVLDAFSLNREALRPMTTAADEKVGQCDPEVSPRGCRSTHELKFLNSGFYAGRAVKVLHYLKYWLLFMHAAQPAASRVKLNPSDQSSALLLMEQFPESVTLDYATMLCSNLYGVNVESIYSLNATSKVWYNNVTKSDVCFFHPNGNKSRISYFTNYKVP